MLAERVNWGGIFLRCGMATIWLSIAVQPGLKAQDVAAKASVTQGNIATLSASARQVIFDRAAFFGQTTALPRWDKNYLVSWDVLTYKDGVPSVRLYDRNGQKVREAAIWFADSQRVVIQAAAVTSDGGILVAGGAEKSDGTTAPFIALVDRVGKIASVIQTAGYAATNICQAPDGTIWTFGGTGYDRETGPKPGNTLRRFDLQKGEVASYFPRSTFPSYPMPDKPAYLTCSATTVIIYSPGAQAYIETPYIGGTPQMYHVLAPADLRVSGFAMTGAKTAYAHFYKANQAGLYCLLFDEATKTATWAVVENTAGLLTKPGAVSGLWGADGENLVVSRSDDGTAHVVHWASPVER
jgi:hypothetical protein